MIGGLLKSTSLCAILAAGGLAASAMSASAADLGVGGNCCADLEERIAELEATTARKGNRKVSLTVSGYVNEAVLFWDDGVESNAYVATNEVSRSRFRFLGSAKIDGSWSAGYLLEIGVRGNKENDLSQGTSSSGKNLDVRHSAWWIQNKDLGKLWVGQTSQATDGITEINLANVGHFITPAAFGNTLNSFAFRTTGGATSNTIGGIFTGSADQGNFGEGSRFNVVKYETPTLAGFIGSAAWGEDDQWDVALRYAGEFSGFKLAAGIGYEQSNDGTSNGRKCAKVNGAVDCNELGLSGSIMHVQTGLFVTGAYGFRQDELRNPALKKKDEFYQVMGGIEQSFSPVGKSTFYGLYQEGSNYGPQTNAAFIGTVGGVNITDATYTQWGLGFNQNIAAAAMDIYVMYNNYSFDLKGVNGARATVNDIDTVTTGARIQF